MAKSETPEPVAAVAPEATAPPEPAAGPAAEPVAEAEASTSAGVPGATDDPIEAAPVEEGEGTFDDADSALGEGDNASSTASLTESILEYRTLNGRTYHSERHGSEGKYWGPNDERQNEAMDMNDMADEYPNCIVVGTDLSPIQPSWCPPNVKFEIDDLEQPWTYAPNSFDYIHIRYMVGGVSDWNKLFRQSFDALKPGGWIESFEVEADYRSDDNTIPPNSAMYMWQDLFTEGGKKLGRPFTILTEDTQRKGIEAAGFVDITVKDIKVPMGSWPADSRLKEIGQWAQYTLEQDLEGFVMFMWNTVLGRSLEEMQVFLASYRRELRTRSIHAYLPQRVVYARKPDTA
ncbi:hypothetical protein Hte_000740 [Hypoxylon texense]